MATIIATEVTGETQSYQWTDYSTADDAAPVRLQNMAGLAGAVQVTGTFGGATIALQVSNDGTNFVTLNDATGAPITFTAAGMREFSTAALFMKPTSTNGTSDNVTVTVVLRG